MTCSVSPCLAVSTGCMGRLSHTPQIQRRMRGAPCSNRLGGPCGKTCICGAHVGSGCTSDDALSVDCVLCGNCSTQEDAPAATDARQELVRQLSQRKQQEKVQRISVISRLTHPLEKFLLRRRERLREPRAAERVHKVVDVQHDLPSDLGTPAGLACTKVATRMACVRDANASHVEVACAPTPCRGERLTSLPAWRHVAVGITDIRIIVGETENAAMNRAQQIRALKGKRM